MSRSPYRITAQLRVDALEVLAAVGGGRLRAAVAMFSGSVLPASESPRIVRLARTVEVALRDAALVATDLDSALGLAARMEDDRELVEDALGLMARSDPRRHVLRGQVAGLI